MIPNPPTQQLGGNLLDILKKKKQVMEYSPGKVSAAIAAGSYLGGAFDNQPTDVYMPGYNMGYLDMKEQRPGYTYIDPTQDKKKHMKKFILLKKQDEVIEEWVLTQ
jgi:hypothetical protein